MLVADASAVLDILVSSQSLEQLGSERVIAPPLLWTEVTAIIRRAEWRLTMDSAAAHQAMEVFLGAAIERRVSPHLYRDALAIAASLGWAKTYDAEYVALARIEGCRLLTTDGRLKRGAGHLVEIVGPTEL